MGSKALTNRKNLWMIVEKILETLQDGFTIGGIRRVRLVRLSFIAVWLWLLTHSLVNRLDVFLYLGIDII